jgi:iron complex transport system substrate-binding protein
MLLTIIAFESCSESDDKTTGSGNRIISLAPHITEIIYALHAQDQLVGVTDFCRYPKEAISKEKIGGLLDPNLEKIIMLKPSHIFGLPSHRKLARELSKYGLTVTIMADENIHDVLFTIKKIGELIDRNHQASQLINQMNAFLNALREHSLSRSIPAALLIGRTKGTLTNMTAAGSGTYINELWHMAGGENSYKDLPSRYGSINTESLLLRDPEVIIEFDMNRERGIYRENPVSEWNFLKNLQAVRKGMIFVIGGDYTLIPGPRLVLLAEDFSRIIDIVRSGQKFP